MQCMKVLKFSQFIKTLGGYYSASIRAVIYHLSIHRCVQQLKFDYTQQSNCIQEGEIEPIKE